MSHQIGSEGTLLGRSLQGARRGLLYTNNLLAVGEVVHGEDSDPLYENHLSDIVSPLSPPCWLHKAKVLCDSLQALLFCFVLFCLSLSLTHSCSFFFFFFSPLSFPWDCSRFLGGLEGGDVILIVSWLCSCTVRWGLADVQLCLLFPGHIPISGTLKFLSPERACTLPSLMTAVGRWITLQAFVWQFQPVAIVHVLKKPHGRDQFDLVLII